MAGSGARDVHGVWLKIMIFSMERKLILDEPGLKSLDEGEGNLRV